MCQLITHFFKKVIRNPNPTKIITCTLEKKRVKKGHTIISDEDFFNNNGLQGTENKEQQRKAITVPAKLLCTESGRRSNADSRGAG